LTHSSHLRGRVTGPTDGSGTPAPEEALTDYTYCNDGRVDTIIEKDSNGGCGLHENLAHLSEQISSVIPSLGLGNGPPQTRFPPLRPSGTGAGSGLCESGTFDNAPEHPRLRSPPRTSPLPTGPSRNRDKHRPRCQGVAICFCSRIADTRPTTAASRRRNERSLRARTGSRSSRSVSAAWSRVGL
jgi:hypothetical protein